MTELPRDLVAEAEHRGCGFDNDPAMHGAALDVTAALEAIAYNLLGTTKMTCAHNSCGMVVGYHHINNHQIACPHGPCTCTEPGCEFAAPPSELVLHLAEAHSIAVQRLPYGESKEVSVPLPLPGSPCSRAFVEGEDGSLFVLTIGALGPANVVSSVCVRSAACAWPVYTVKIWAHGPQTSSKANCRSDVVMMEAEVSSSASPSAVGFEELTSFLAVPGRYMVGAGPSKQLRLQIEISSTA